MRPAARSAHEAELSHSEIHSVLRDALKTRHPNAWVWLEDVYDDRVVYTVEPKDSGTEALGGLRYYQADYLLGEADEVTIGNSIEVERVVTYVPVAAPVIEGACEMHGDIVPLREAQGQHRQVKIIEPGWGSSGYWSAEVLERDGPAAWPLGTQMFIDHPTVTEEAERPERSVRDLAATLATPASFNAAGPAGPGLYAEAVVAEPYSDLIGALAEDIGLSVNTWAEAPIGEAEGRKGPIVTRIASAEEAPLNSVDFVTKAGAGGRVLALMESLRPKVVPPPPSPTPQHEAESTATASRQEVIEMDETKLQEQLDSAKTRIVELETENTGVKAENGTLRERVAMHEATKVVAGMLGESDLPDVTIARLTEGLAKSVTLTEDGVLDVEALKARTTETIAAEAEYLAKITESGKVRDQGASTATGDTEALKASFKRRYLAEGKGEERADQMAAAAV